MLLARRRNLVSSLSSPGIITAPSVGTITSFVNSDIGTGLNEYTFSHVGAGSHLLLCVALKGSTDVGPPTYTLNKVTYNSTAMTKIGENDLNLLAGQPTVLAFLLSNPTVGSNDVEFDITPSSGDVQCAGMAAINLTDCGGIGTGLDSDGSGGQATVATSQSLSLITSANNSRVFGITAVRAANNAGTVSTPVGYTEHLDLGTGPSDFTDVAFAVHSIEKATAGSQAYATSWTNSNSFGSLAFELLGSS